MREKPKSWHVSPRRRCIIGPVKSLDGSAYLRALDERVLVFDGAMGTQLMALELSADDFGGAPYHGCNEALVLTRPDIVAAIHESYLAAGADVVETDSFTGSRLKLGEYGLHEKTYEINYCAAEIARRACDAVATARHPRFVAGSIGPTGMLISSSDPTLSKITYAELRDIYGEQVRALVEGGADLLLLETMQDLLELKAAIAGARREFARGLRRVPIQAQPTLISEGRMLLGTDIRAVCATLDALDVDVVGLNCSTGPAQMRDSIRYLCENARAFVSVVPNAGLPLMGQSGETIYPELPEELAHELASFVEDFGVNAVGGCCGTTPQHISALRAAVQSVERKRRVVAERAEEAASAITAVSLVQQPAPLIVGERINAQGSRRIKRLLLAEDYDAIALVAREQVEGGAHVLDVCCALTERADEDEQMRHVVRRLAQSIEAPLVIDSTEPKVLETALQNYAGRAVINSVHLESGRAKMDAVMPLAREHGAAVIALTIDESGMAKTAARKVEVARRIYDIAVKEYGLPPGALIFDDLTFTLATGDAEFRDSAKETIEGITLIKRELPGVLTSLGVSNVSFGLKPAARGVLNSVFLHHCVQAGLDCALVHAKEIVPYFEIDAAVRELCDDLVFNAREDALARLIEHFEANAGESAADATMAEAIEDLPIEQRIAQAILGRRKDGIEAKIDEALEQRTPVQVLNEILLPAMKEVGDRFGRGELILPFVLQSAEVMKKAVAHLEQFLERRAGATKGTVVLATVFGDVHDIGKNLVHTILSNNGYTVHDLGKQVPMNVILDKAVEVQADAIGLSALLVSTSKQMPICVEEQDSRGLHFPVIVGGAAINRDFGRRIAMLDDGERFFEPGLFYARDAFEGLEIVDALTGDAARRDALLEAAKRDAVAAQARRRPAAVTRPVAVSAVKQEHADVPTPPFWGARTLEPTPDVLWPCFDLRSLYRLSWGAANVKGGAFERLVADEFEPRLRRYQRESIEDGTLLPRAVYGYFPAAGASDNVILYDPRDHRTEVARMEFPRQVGGEHLSLADYLREPQGGGPSDVVALQIVTVGERAAARIAALQSAGEYSEAYFLHGFSVQSAEALAEYVHRHIRAELGLPEERGKRYSWGYGACPDLSQHEIVFRLLDATKAIGVTLTPGFQIVPEQSTAAIVMHHPKATYFNAAAVRELAAS
ncbi:MAG: methionine synthase [Candidatus Eremiobacteraeota bacterium]|nr:methionine synthase [Candidatus Eremiobacteraeota bacterium]